MSLADVFTVPMISHSLQLLNFEQEDDPVNMGGSQIKFDKMQHFQCSQSTAKQQLFIRLYFKKIIRKQKGQAYNKDSLFVTIACKLVNQK